MDNLQATAKSQVSAHQHADEPPATFAGGWRQRVTYLAMSLFVGWHTLAIIIAPTPTGSEIVQSLRSLVQPYIYFFRLDNQWSFFAPKVGRQGPFRYVVEASDGKRHVFVPSEEPPQSIAQYFMWREWKYYYDKLMDSPDARGYLIAGLFCKKHAALNPVSIMLLRVQERDFSVEDYLQGYRPEDARFTNVVSLGNIDC